MKRVFVKNILHIYEQTWMASNNYSCQNKAQILIMNNGWHIAILLTTVVSQI